MRGELEERAMWGRVEELFHLASERAPENRDLFLAKECGLDDNLKARVKELLASCTNEDHLATAIREESELVFEQPGALHEGERVGAFCVKRMLGRGGMGNVYAGTRDDGQYQQEVAIKLLRPDMAGAESVKRILAERQILAGLNHPNIARLLDGGVTGQGLPYLVMEYVDGVPIDEYCRQRMLNIPERLVLFQQVCAAVQYAHHNLVIHRDLKPSNILVTKEGVPKLLDFGIAKLLSEGEVNNPVAVTRLAERPMTLDYASPEQVLGKATNMATDIFALGTLLYELLSGCRPYETRDTHPLEAQRRICELEPIRPSVHNRLLSRELDDIVRMAIRKEPQARYSSVERFSADIQNFLEGFPVAAAKGDTRYRAAKFIQRHKWGVSLAAAAVLLLSAFAVGMAVLAVNYARERDSAKLQSSRAEQVTQFLTDLFKASDPFRAKGQTLTAKELLDAGAKRIGKELQTQPAVRVRVREAIGLAYEHLDATDRAEDLYRSAVDDATQAYGGQAKETARQLRYLGDAQRQQSKLPEAEKHLRESLAILDLGKGGEDEKANILNNLGLVLQERGQAFEGEKLFRRAVGLAGQFGKDPSDMLTMKSNLGGICVDLGRYKDAEVIFRQVLEQRRALLGKDHPQVYRSMQRLGHLLELNGAYEEAETLDRAAILNFTRLLNAQHSDVLVTKNNLALVLQETGRTPEAEEMLRFSLATGLRNLPPGHVTTMLAEVRLGALLTQKGEWVEAEQLLVESTKTVRRSMGTTLKNAATVLSRYGRLKLAKGKTDEAEPLFEEALLIERKRRGDEHPTTADFYFDMGNLRTAQKRYPEAERFYQQALAIDRKMLPAGHLQTAAHLLGYSRILRSMGRSAEAEPLAREAFASRKVHMSVNSWPVREAEKELQALAVK